MNDWRKAVLKTLGFKPTGANMKFLSTWQRWEGGHTANDAQWNWLNTTSASPGAIGSINSVGVKRFDTFQHGVQATAQTIMNGYYDDIVDALASGNPYAHDLSKGLSTWVRGPNGGIHQSYVDKVMAGGGSVPKVPKSSLGKVPGAPKIAAPKSGGAPTPQSDAWGRAMSLIFDDDPNMFGIMTSLNPYDDVRGSKDIDKPSPHATPGKAPKGDITPFKFNGERLQPGTTWKGTHVTDGLDWNSGKQTARDIMAAAGTAVVAPESGTILKHGGAQGGEAMYFMSDSGHLYWLGHIDNMLAVGTRVGKGKRLALISADHAAPHLHIDRYYGSEPGRYT